MRGFTTVRDVGGPVFGLKRAIDEGGIAGPRIYPSGAMITATEPEKPADVAGLMSYDVVVRLDREPVAGVDDLIRLLNAGRIGRAVKVDVLRRGQLRSFEVRPTERRNK